MRAIILILMLGAVFLSAIQIPYSDTLIKADFNCISGMERISPADRQQIPLKTDCWFWHDGKNLYAYWELEIGEGFYPGAYATRDDSQSSDYVRLQIKTLKNEDFAYYFSVYPYGSCYDAVRKDNFQVDRAWNSFFDCESDFDEKLWKVKMKIPFKDLRYEGEPPYQWGISLARQVHEENSAYGNPYSPTSGFSIRQYFDSFEPGIINDRIDSPGNIQVVPYLYSSYDIENENYSDLSDNVGLNISYRPTDNSLFKAAFNPDFTETPIDEERDTHNNKYPPQYGENRRFFTEDLNAFGVGDGLFYTRNIMQPVYALKYTATGSDWNFAVLSAMDKENKSMETVTNYDDLFNVIAFKKNYSQFSNHSTFLTRMNSKYDYYNYVVQTYPFYQIDQTTSISGRFVYTHNQISGLVNEQGHRISLGLNKRFNQLSSDFYFNYLSKYYMPGMANYESQFNKNSVSGGYNLYYDTYVPDSFIRTYNIYHNLNAEYEREDLNSVRNRYGNLGVNLNFINQTNLSASINGGSDRLSGILTDWYEGDLNASWDFFKPMNGYVGTTYGRNINYTFEKSKMKQVIYGGISGYLGPMISYNIRNNHIVWLDIKDSPEFDCIYDIGNFDLELTFNSRIKIVSGARYNNYEYLTQSQHLGYFTTLHWYINPTSSLYAGYKSTADEINDRFERSSASIWMKINKVF
ncbi:MAG: hypothetical protein KA886_10830 [Candidatus Cloacimonetes bacterium]|nr:hypothetical protein [Candidatus Cloacimonadota bacterium]